MTETLFELPGPQAVPRPDLSAGHAVIVDGNNLAARSFHAAKGRLTSATGVETGSLHLFGKSLSRFLHDLRPTHLVVCWDGGRSAYREAIYGDYKLGRREMYKHSETFHSDEVRQEKRTYGLVAEFLSLCGIEQWRQEHVEADDLIAAGHRATRAAVPDRHITIMSSDKDLLQLLDERTHQLRFSSHGTQTDVWDRRRVIANLGHTPEQIPLVMALTGDQSDGVPGIRGIGPVKARKILDGVGWDWAKLASDARYPELDTMRKLVDLTGELCCETGPVPDYRPLTRTSPDAGARLEKLTDFCAGYQLRELWEGVVGGTLWP